MRKIISFLLFLDLLLLAFKAPSSFAQSPLPFKDAAKIIFGIGGESQDTEPAPGPRPEGFVYYCQYGGVNANGGLISSQRGKWDYGSCSIQGSGCGPTSVAMILSTYGSAFTPTAISKDWGGIGCSEKTQMQTHDVTDMDAWLDQRGFRLGAEMFSYDEPHIIFLNRVEKFFSDNAGKNYYIVAGAPVKINTNSGLVGPWGHWFVITGIDPATKDLFVMDPTFCEGDHIGGARKLRDVNNFNGGSVGTNPKSGYTGWFGAWPITPK